MTKKIAVETLSLPEISELFQESINIAFPKSKGAIAYQLKRLKKNKIPYRKWIKSYFEFFDSLKPIEHKLRSFVR